MLDDDEEGGEDSADEMEQAKEDDEVTIVGPAQNRTRSRTPPAPPQTPVSPGVQTMDQLLQRLDAFHPTAANRRCRATELPAPVLARIRPQLQYFLAASIAAAVFGHSHRTVGCGRLKGGRSRTGKHDFQTDFAPCSNCSSKNLVCVRLLPRTTRPVVMPVDVRRIRNESDWADPGRWAPQ